MRIVLISLMALVLGGCAVSDSMLEYSKEGTARVASGYEAKTAMTASLVAYLTEANKECGVRVEVINGVPVTTVRECIRPSDVLASVDNVKIIQPQNIETITDGIGDMLIKATNIVVPVSSIYYGYKNNIANQNASVAINESNNEAQTSMWSGYTNNFQNTTDTSSTINTSSSITTNSTSEINNEEIPSISIDANNTNIN